MTMHRARGLFLTAMFVIVLTAACSGAAMQSASADSGKWWETGLSPDYPRSTYLSASGFGATVNEAKNDALKNLSRMLRAKVESKTVLQRKETETSLSKTNTENLTIKTDEILRNVFYPKVQFFSGQNGYYALAVLNRKKEAMALMTKSSRLRLDAAMMRERVNGTQDPLEKARYLRSLVGIEEKIYETEEERSLLGGAPMVFTLPLMQDREALRTLQNRTLTVSIRIDGEGPQPGVLADGILQKLSDEGFRKVAGDGKIRIEGKVHTEPMPPFPGSPYTYVHFDVTASVIDGSTGQVVRLYQNSGRVGGLNFVQARSLLNIRLRKDEARAVAKTVVDYVFPPMGGTAD
jgi:hypothetical protein